MFYVGAFAHYNGARDIGATKVQVLEKLGHSRGRAERFLTTHPPKEINGKSHRAIVFVLGDGFRLANDAIQLSARVHHCEWTEAKFHCYRLAAKDAIGKQDVWADLLQQAHNIEAVPIVDEAEVVAVPVVADAEAVTA